MLKILVPSKVVPFADRISKFVDEPAPRFRVFDKGAGALSGTRWFCWIR